MATLTQLQIQRYLLTRDKQLAPLMKYLPYPRARRATDIYATLIGAIISQQLSVKAANTIHQRVLDLFEDRYPTPESLLRLRTPQLRRAGLSQQKTQYLKSIARFALEEGLEFKSLARKTDAELINLLTQIHGVGKWTVEMLLMFSFHRPDVFSVDDVGIQNAMRELYQLDETGRVFKQRLITIAESWRPYRTVVCKYLWGWKAIAYRR